MLERFGKDDGGGAIARDPMAVATRGHRLIVEDLVRAVRAGREPAIPIAEAKHAVEVVCAIYKSARTGRRVLVRGTGR